MMVTILLTIVVLGIIILVHEAGHFLMARRAGILCHEFSIGFGPEIASWGSGETKFALRAIPLGGYVLMAGETPSALEGEESVDAVPVGRRMTDQTPGVRAKVMAAGSVTNIVLAIIIFFTIYAIVGVPFPTLTIAEVQEGLPGAEAGLAVGDRIIAVDGEPVDEWMEVVESVRASPGEAVRFQVERDDTVEEITVIPEATPEGEGSIGFAGIGSETTNRRFPVWIALAEAVAWTGMVIVILARTLGEMVLGTTGTDQLMGIVGIGSEVGRATQMGLASLLSLVGSISASVGLINLLPLPVLDGGRLVLLGVEAVSGKTLDPEQESWINLIGVALLILLALYVTVQDILRITG